MRTGRHPPDLRMRPRGAGAVHPGTRLKPGAGDGHGLSGVSDSSSPGGVVLQAAGRRQAGAIALLLELLLLRLLS